MSLQTIEEELPRLSPKEREVLIQKLLLSLDSPSEEELRQEWFAEAKNRANELDNGLAATSGETVLRKARALIDGL
ncbi:MAG: addiction module protein [Campylobacterales bacterium]